MEARARRDTDALTWASAGLYAIGFALLFVVALAGVLSLLWAVIPVVLGALVLSLLVEFRWRRRRRQKALERGEHDG